MLAACEAHYERKRRQIFIEYVMLAGVNDGYSQAVQLARDPGPADLQAQPDPVQPDGLVYDGSSPQLDRRLQGRARGARAARHRPPHARARHRRRLRPARRQAGRSGTLSKPRAVIADDELLLRQGLERLLTDGGIEVVASAGDASDLIRKTRAHKPDVVITDVRMPPDQTDDGLRAAIAIRRSLPGTGVLVLSQHLDERYALDLLGDDAQGVGYLLKDRVADLDDFLAAVRVAAGGSALDPEVVARMIGRRRSAIRSRASPRASATCWR